MHCAVRTKNIDIAEASLIAKGNFHGLAGEL